MSDIYDDNDFDTTEDVSQEESAKPDRKWVRELEKRAKGAEQAKAEAEAAKRELALLKAGINLDSPQGKLFVKAYDGDPTVEAIQAAAREYGVLDAPAEPSVPAEELAAMDRISSAGAGSAQGAGADWSSQMAAADSPAAVIDILRKAGVEIVNDEPGRWVSIAGR